MRLTWPLLALIILFPWLLQTSHADEFNGERGNRGHDHRRWNGDRWHLRMGDEHWRHGRWLQSWHGGRYGWWWQVGGSWLLYNTPVYPYPMTAPIVVIAPPPQTAIAPGALPPPPASTWYYCQQPQGYYPYIPSCPSGWQPVASVPPDLHE
ncbi:MAG: hypothetical protein HKM02_02465 [Pseudomonadales bacterium]|nr:hypothetical protein [Pseudomonadales bacterium]